MARRVQFFPRGSSFEVGPLACEGCEGCEECEECEACEECEDADELRSSRHPSILLLLLRGTHAVSVLEERERLLSADEDEEEEEKWRLLFPPLRWSLITSRISSS